MATRASEWKSAAKPLELTVPSGNTCLIRRPGLPAFFRAGIIPNSLMPMLQQAVKGENIDEKTLQKELISIMDDPKKLDSLLGLQDEIMVYCLVEPKVLRSRYVEGDDIPEGLSVGDEIPYDRRDPETGLYVDTIDDEDKAFVFQWAVGGTSDLEQFRAEQTAGMEPLLERQDVGDETEPAAGT